jgi:hypothetical protein
MGGKKPPKITKPTPVDELGEDAMAMHNFMRTLTKTKRFSKEKVTIQEGIPSDDSMSEQEKLDE